VKKVLLALSAAAWLQAAEIRGTVVDARGGEPLARVDVLLTGTTHRTLTDPAGKFTLTGVPAGEYTLNVTTVGYRLGKKSFQLAAQEVKEFEVILSPDTFRHTEKVEVKEDPFEPARMDSPSQLTLAGNDMKNLASVLADDPLRAVQSLPGVASNDDFDARFSLRGADYSRLGLYVDGVLLHMPFHTIQGQGATGSATAFNNDMLESLELHGGAFPSRFSDRTGGALDVHTREGSRTEPHFRATASASNAGLMAEGPLGKHGSWLAGGRKSYLQYLIERTSTDSSIVFGMWDTQGRISYDLSKRHNVSLNILEGQSNLDRSSARNRLGANSIMGATYHYTFVNLGWRYTPTERLLVTSRAAYMRERFDDWNAQNLQLGAGYYGEWVASTTATWMWNGRNPLEAGVSGRRLRDDGFSQWYQFTPAATRRLDDYFGNAWRTGGFLQQSWSAWSGKVRLTAGGRWDRHSMSDIEAFTPQASVGLAPWSRTRIQLGWGQYVQYPEISQLTSRFGGVRLLPERANHFIAAIEQRLGDRTRIRAEFYNRNDRDLLFRPLYEPRLLSTSPLRIFAPLANASYINSQRGYARGVEFFIQRSSANRLTGWVSYALGYTRVRDSVLGQSFPADLDQRHTVNVYGGYRIKPTVNTSIRWMYGSGFPVPGFFQGAPGAYFLAPGRNATRLGAYQRLDTRVNKAWTFDKWKLTLYGEVVNLTNRLNRRFDSYNGYNSRTGAASISLDKMFPILPSAGIVFER
jgi:hypothetical protein